MAKQQEDTSEIFFQTWTVPPQPLVNTQIVSETNQQAIPLNMNVVSTDTTAIWSFIAAMIASMVISIWFGRKGFELTEMSFNVVKDQIKSSELLVRSSNQELIQTSLAIKSLEIRDNHKILILNILTEFEFHLFTLQVYLKALNDKKETNIELLRPQAKKSYQEIELLQFKLKNFLKANHDVEIDLDLNQIFLNINVSLDKSNFALGSDNELLELINLGNDLINNIHDAINKAT